MEFEVEAETGRFDSEDDRWLAQVAQLAAALEREVGGVTRRATAAPGAKGGFGAVVLALASAGAFTAAVEVIKAFVARDEGRSVRLSWYESGRVQSIEVGGRGIDDAAVARVVGMLGGSEEPLP